MIKIYSDDKYNTRPYDKKTPLEVSKMTIDVSDQIGPFLSQ